jgi:hypothetical protein
MNLIDWGLQLLPDYASERAGSLSWRARVRRARQLAPATRLKAPRPAAQRER